MTNKNCENFDDGLTQVAKHNQFVEMIKNDLYNIGFKEGKLSQREDDFKEGLFITNATNKDIRVLEFEAISEDEEKEIELGIIPKECGQRVYPTKHNICITEQTINKLKLGETEDKLQDLEMERLEEIKRINEVYKKKKDKLKNICPELEDFTFELITDAKITPKGIEKENEEVTEEGLNKLELGEK